MREKGTVYQSHAHHTPRSRVLQRVLSPGPELVASTHTRWLTTNHNLAPGYPAPLAFCAPTIHVIKMLAQNLSEKNITFIVCFKIKEEKGLGLALKGIFQEQLMIRKLF